MITHERIRDISELLGELSRHGESVALSFYRGKALQGRLVHRELGSRVEELAAALRAEHGVAPGDRVAILAPNRLEVPVLVLALLRLGAIVVPLNPTSAVEDWGYILGHSGACGLFATRELVERVPVGVRPGFTVLVEDVFGMQARAGGLSPRSPGELAEFPAIVLYTSGTTGSPKGVVLRQRNLIANALSMAHNFRLGGTTQLAVLPLYHAHAFGFGLMTALSTGGHLVFTERLEPFTWMDVVRSESVAVSSVVPTLLPMLLGIGVKREKVPTLRHLLVSSAPLPIDLARDFESHTGIPIIHGWGLSEYTNFACCASPDAPAETHERLMFSSEVPSIGPALEGTDVRVIDENGAPVGEGVRGELVVHGHSTMVGYFKDEENTARILDANGWLHTGDEGFFRLDEGRPVFFVTGRIKEIIIRDAEKFSPLRLERRLVESLPELSGRLVVLGFAHHAHGEEVGVYVEIETLDEALRARLAEAVATLSAAERPKVVLHGAAPIPRTHTGKVQRRKMQPWFAGWNNHRGALVVERLPVDVLSS
jgi:long-chain acyl-CoA synthetase